MTCSLDWRVPGLSPVGQKLAEATERKAAGREALHAGRTEKDYLRQIYMYVG